MFEEIAPNKFKYFTTWSWWSSVVIAFLHAGRIIPGFVASGMFPLALVVAIFGSAMMIMCNTTKVCRKKNYQAYIERRHLLPSEPRVEEAWSERNIIGHLFPLLLLCCALIANPAKTTFFARLAVAFVLPVIYLVWSASTNQLIDKVYHIPKLSYVACVSLLVLLCLIDT